MLNIKKFLLAIGLIPKSTSEIDSQGELEVLDTDGKLRYHDGTSVSPVVTESHEATLTNKTFDANGVGNSISNIETEDLASGVLNTNTSLTGSTDTQIPSALAVKTYVDNSTGTISNDVGNLVTLSGVPVDSTSLGTFTGDTIPDNQNNKEALQALETAHENHTDASTDVHNIGETASVVGTDTSQTLTNKTIDADNNTISNIQTSNLKAGVLNTDATLATASNTQIPSALAVKTYVDDELAAQNDASEISYSNTTSGLSASTVQAAIDEVDNNVDNLITLSGMPVDSTDLGTFTGGTIPDNQTVKAALQDLESAHESHTGASANVHGIGATASVVGTDTSQALTNKTLTGAVIDGSTKISALLLEESEDNTQSGSLVTLTGFTKPIIRLTNASLLSITGLTASELTGHGGVVTLVNATANEITILNNAGTATEAILTGTDDDIDLAPNGCLLLKYDVVTDQWRVIGGTGGGNVVIKALAGEDLTARTPVYLSVGAADDGRVTGSAYKLDADSDDRIEFVGFVKDTVTTGNTVKIVTSGILKGFTGLSVGEPVYLDALNAGVVTQVEPTAFRKWVIRLGIAVSSTQVLILSDQGMTGYFNEETQGLLSIANNQIAAANLANLIFDFNDSKKFILDYGIYRRTDSESFAQNGTLRGVYNEDSGEWLMSDTYAGENAGVTFSITTLGQIQYTSTSISGSNYSGVFEYKIGVGEGVVGSVGGTTSGSSGINYITNSDLETDSSGYNTYNDTAGTSPVDGTGAVSTPLSTFERSTSAPLRGLASGLFTKPAGNRQGDGVSFDFLIDAADKAQVLRISFDYSTSVNYVDGDVRVYIFDKTNSRLIEVIDRDLSASSFGKYVGTFQTSPDSVDYRLILHVSSVNADDYTIFLDNVIVGPQTIIKGAVVTDWEAVSLTGTWVSNTTYDSYSRRVGDSLEIISTISTSGLPTAATLQVNIPSGLTIDLARLPVTDREIGTAWVHDSTASNRTKATVETASNTTVQFVYIGGSVVTNNLPFAFGAGDSVHFRLSVPILGWSSNMVLSEDAGNREIVFRSALVNPTSVALNGTTNLIFPSVAIDTASGYNPTTGVYTVSESGIYDIKGSVLIGGTEAVNNKLELRIRINGVTTYVGANTIQSTGLAYQQVKANTLYYLNKGDTVNLVAFTEIASAIIVSGVQYHSFEIAKRSSPQTIAASEVVACRYASNSGQIPAVPTGTGNTIIKYEDIVYDTHNAYDISTGVYTVPQTGYYSINASIMFESATGWTEGETASLSLNNADNLGAIYEEDYREFTANPTSAVYPGTLKISSVIYFTKGTRLAFVCEQTNDAALNLIQAQRFNVMSIVKINGIL